MLNSFRALQFWHLLIVVGILILSPPAGGQSNPTHMAAISEKPRPWPDGIIPYDISSLTETQQNLAKRAMQRWMDTGARLAFIPRTNEIEYVRFTGNTDAGNNTSLVGYRKGTRADINITAFWWRQGEWMPTHELGHVLGFFHEHSRWDRDEFVTIHYENIKDGRQGDYDWAPKTNWIVSATGYDYRSIMHYRVCWSGRCEAECQDGDGSSPCAVIDPVGTNYDRIIGQWGDNGISETDGEKARLVYGTNAAWSAVEKEYEELQAKDDAAQTEVNKWVQAREETKAKSGDALDPEFEKRVRERFEPVCKAYEEFVGRHPTHVPARLTYGSFLSDRNDEAGAKVQWEKALELDPGSAAAHNNLAGIYSEDGHARKALDYFAKAIQLSPEDAHYYRNFGDAIYVLRKVAMDYYHIDEQQVYARALDLYRNAARLDPKDFSIASVLAQTYYVIRPLPVEEGLQAWTNALALAPNAIEREGVGINLARLKMLDGRYAESRAQLAEITNANYAIAKSNLLMRIGEREKAPATNSVPAADQKPPR